MINGKAIIVACIILFSLPALSALVSQGWRGETGSLAPIVLLLGGWTVFHTAKEDSNEEHTANGSLLVWATFMIPVILLYCFAQAIEMVSAMAFAAWLGIVNCLYVWRGFQTLLKCILPITLTALAIPLPYTLSSSWTAWLRQFTSKWSVYISDTLGLDVAHGTEEIILGPYSLSVENACAGATSMLSLVAIGILYAYWFRSNGKFQTLFTVLAALPIAFLSNILRVIFLLYFVNFFGVSILDTIIHPASGILSFGISICLLLIWSQILKVFTFEEKITS